VTEKTPQEKYAYHFSLWTLWSQDLIDVLATGSGNEKRKKYLLAQIFVQLEEMSKYLNAEKQEAFQAVRRELTVLEEKMQKPESLRDESALKRTLQRTEKTMRNNFHPQM
jgi:hypothetical protein